MPDISHNLNTQPLQTPVSSAELKPVKLTNYSFINLIRFICMIGIVWAHIPVSAPFKSTDDIRKHIDNIDVYIAFFQIFKFAVMGFFIVSGFLLGNKLNNVEPLDYFKRRFLTTFKPYLVAFALIFLLIFVRVYFFHRHVEDIASAKDIIPYLLINSYLWYLPNYLLCLGVLLIFNKIIYKNWFGLCLLTVTLIYTFLTVYVKQYQMPHSLALFAYVFYLWLGTYINKIGFIDKIYRTNTGLLITLTIVAYLLSCAESSYLYRAGLSYFNILRIFNQFYALSIVALLIKICPKSPRFWIFNPREETYGIYLYHGIFVYSICPKLCVLAYTYFHVEFYSYAIIKFIPIHIIYFAATYLMTVLLVKVLLRFNLGYLKQPRNTGPAISN